MADPQSNNTRDLEQYKFGRDSKDNVIVKTKLSDGDLVIGVDYDTIDVTFPNGSTEVYTYSLSTTTVQIIQITYTNNSKNEILKVETL